MVGVAKNIQPMWKKIRELVNLDPETELVDHVYVGCTQRSVPPQKSTVLAKQQMFSQLLSKETSDKKAGGDTDTVDSDTLSEKSSQDQQDPYVHPSILKPTLTDKELKAITAWELDMSGHAEQCVDRYCELAHCIPGSLKKVATPCLGDRVLTEEELQAQGRLQDVAARIVLKCLYLARIGRPDILW